MIKELQALGLNVIPMGAIVVPEPLMTEPLVQAVEEQKADETVQKEAVELEEAAGGSEVVADSDNKEVSEVPETITPEQVERDGANG